ncbi:MAG: helix-turn-helix domain-containing protein [Methylobacter sp.]|nr:helix-turn-helix domain-containing protein [Methylobacter sp.]
MSVKAMAIAWDADLKPGAKLVLLAIADHADGQGFCWPGQEHIAEKCGMNRSTVNQHIGNLVGSGYLTIEKNRSKTGQAVKAAYRVVMEIRSKKEAILEKPTLGITTSPTLENATLGTIKPTLEKPTLEKHDLNVVNPNIPSLYEPSRTINSFCADLIGSPQAVIKIPLNISGTFHEIFESDIEKYSGLYPAVDVMQKLRNMVGWSDANPTKRKTKGGVKRFINSWLAKDQDRGGSKLPQARVAQQIQPTPKYIPPGQRGGIASVINSTAKKI